jgi:SAM-dependent methyltransferase
VLIASEVIEHIVNTEFFASEMHRILKPNGHVILTTPNLYYWLNRLKFLFARTPWNYPGVSSQFKADPNINLAHIRVNGIREWSSFFNARGLRVLSTQGVNRVPPSATSFKSRIIRLVDRLMPQNALCLALFLLQKK